VVFVNLKDSTRASDVPGLWYQVRKKVGDIKRTLSEGVQGPFFNDEFGDTSFAEYVIGAARYVGRLPHNSDMAQMAPILCAGVTSYKGIEETEARPGEWLAISGIGGLGQLAVQYAKAGYENSTISYQRGARRPGSWKDRRPSDHIDGPAYAHRRTSKPAARVPATC
jgi:NADPH:quinone reductase-like Zn-dependent oxidoreductase